MTGSVPKSPVWAWIGLSLAGLAAIAAAAMYAALSTSDRTTKYTGSAANPSVGAEIAAPVAVAPPERRPAAPHLVFAAPDGRAMKLADLRGRALLVNLWTTWCPPCRREMPALNALAAKMDGPHFQVITISLDRGGSAVAARWLTAHKLGHLRAYSADAHEFPNALLPTSMLIDAQGRLAWRGLGDRAWASKAVMARIRTLIGR